MPVVPIKMRKVLFIAYDFLPCRNIGGALRSSKFVNYLSRFGWKAYVVADGTFQAPDLEEDYDEVARLVSMTPYTRPYYVVPYGWALSLWRFIRSFRHRHDIDLGAKIVKPLAKVEQRHQPLI